MNRLLFFIIFKGMDGAVAKESRKLFGAVDIDTRYCELECGTVLECEDERGPDLTVMRTGRPTTRWVDDTINVVDNLVTTAAVRNKSVV